LTEIFQKIFGPRKPNNKEIPTIPLSKDRDVPETPADTPSVQLETAQLEVGCAQSIGKQRDHNEDALFTLTTNLNSEQSQTLLGLYIVADGMGGHKHGEIASGLAVRTISNHITHKLFSSLLSPTPSAPPDSIQEMLQDSVQEAHRVIMKNAPGAGTTVTAVLILNEKVTIVHVGDSRAYDVSKTGSINVLTRDHSLVMRMMELGQLTAEEASIHPQRNVLYRALGQGEPFTPDITTFQLPNSGYLLLCSDGLWGVVPENEISEIIITASDPQMACQLMVDAANQHGGPDNITAILVSLPG
jgi:serine/threonine protein phosphatase PrpC